MVFKLVIKCMLVGDSDVGKTCLLTAYTENRFPTGYIPRTYGGHGMEVMVRDDNHIFQVFDNAGAPEHDRLRPLGYPHTDVFVICFSVGIPTSFANVKPRWLSDAQHYCPGKPCILAATQIDLRQPNFNAVDSEEPRQMITTAQGEKLAREIKAVKFVECSALTRECVQDVFDAVRAASHDSCSRPPELFINQTQNEVCCALEFDMGSSGEVWSQ
ncbi:Cell division control protein 42 [Mycena sanguinolenta]|uniref:Cell division control protein 42 n=1 Tax=Mycena sanguinolenta TaxID=230812 RepID=A0A8H6YI57_9AGAR|nr:Cell division control protein 42 [Mycena sanguinolenta]